MLCECVTPIEPPRGITLNYVHLDQNAHFVADPRPSQTVDETSKFIHMLVDLGVRKNVAQQLVETHKDQYSGDDADFIRLLMKQKA